jgi:hypothetical protein
MGVHRKSGFFLLISSNIFIDTGLVLALKKVKKLCLKKGEGRSIFLAL